MGGNKERGCEETNPKRCILEGEGTNIVKAHLNSAQPQILHTLQLLPTHTSWSCGEWAHSCCRSQAAA